MLPFLSLRGRKSRPVCGGVGGPFCSKEDLVRRGKKDISWIPGLWPEQDGLRRVDRSILRSVTLGLLLGLV